MWRSTNAHFMLMFLAHPGDLGGSPLPLGSRPRRLGGGVVDGRVSSRMILRLNLNGNARWVVGPLSPRRGSSRGFVCLDRRDLRRNHRYLSRARARDRYLSVDTQRRRGKGKEGERRSGKGNARLLGDNSHSDVFICFSLDTAIGFDWALDR